MDSTTIFLKNTTCSIERPTTSSQLQLSATRLPGISCFPCKNQWPVLWNLKKINTRQLLLQQCDSGSAKTQHASAFCPLLSVSSNQQQLKKNRQLLELQFVLRTQERTQNLSLEMTKQLQTLQLLQASILCINQVFFLMISNLQITLITKCLFVT